MGENEAIRLLQHIQQSNLTADDKDRLRSALTYAVRYGQMLDVLIDTEVCDGNREFHVALWEATDFRITERGQVYRISAPEGEDA